MGRQPSYGFMVKKLKQIWERKGNIDIFDLENDFYLINFQHMDDYMEALTGGPWVITDAYLSVARWKPDFSPKNERIESVVAWVRFPDLPVPLFDKKFLLNLGNSIGKAIRLDVHTAQRARGKFARMCVELDLTKPLVPEFEVNGQILSVAYESMNLLCNKCGWYGHFREGHEAFHRRKSEEGMEVDVEMQGRNPVTPAHASHSGSRFTILQEEPGNNEEGLDAGKGKREEGTGAVSGFKKGLREEHQFVQKRQGKLGAMGESKKGNEAPVQAGFAGSGQMPRKVMTGKGGNVLKAINKGVARGNEVGTCNVVGSQEIIPESDLELFKGREVDMFGKENLHPGELREKNVTNSGRTKPMDGIEDPMDSMGMNMAEILVWNSRGAASKGFAAVLKELRCRYKVDLVVIVEPRVSGNPATRIIKNWGFKHSIRVEAEGFSGGIWLLWSLEELRVEVLVRNDQFIHCRLSLEGRETLFTAVYASPSEQRRLVTWDLLQELASEVVEPWLLTGDFNEIKSPLEQKGLGRVNESRCTRFNGWIQNCNLLDMQAKGPFFTWKGPK
ncbi:hypothetical protein K1719_033797 [Acacia pycnantha]|nr:hypothetical protein K1719_033797 [Acacia pycnantha]